MTQQPVTIVHANLRNSRRGLRHLVDLGADSLGLNEANRLAVAYGRLKRYRPVVGHSNTDRRRGAKATPVLVRRGLPALGEVAVKASEAARPARVAPERWITAALYDHPGVGPFAHVEAHPNAAVRGLDPATNARAAGYERLALALGDLLVFLEGLGLAVAVTMDAQLTPRNEDTFRGTTPYDVFDQMGMDTRHTGIDLLAVSPSLAITRFQTIPAARLGSDHDGFLAAMKRAR